MKPYGLKSLSCQDKRKHDGTILYEVVYVSTRLPLVSLAYQSPLAASNNSVSIRHYVEVRVGFLSDIKEIPQKKGQKFILFTKYTIKNKK